MALKDIWKDKIDGVDDVLAEDINTIANAVITNENVISAQGIAKQDKLTEEQLTNIADVPNKADKEVVNSIQDDIKKKVDKGSNNGQLFNCFTTVDGYRMTDAGQLVTDTARFYSDYIEVKPDCEYYLNTKFVYVSYWDNDKNYVSGVAPTSSAKVLTIPSNAKYVILSCGLTSKYKLALFEGNTNKAYDISKTYIDDLYIKDISLERYLEPLPLYKQVAYIFDEELYRNDSGGNNTVQYVGYDCGENNKPTSIKCKAKWFKGQSNAGSVIVLINSPRGLDNIKYITHGAIHLEINPAFFTLGLYPYEENLDIASKPLVRLADNKPFSKPCVMDGETQYEFELEISDTQLIVRKKCLTDSTQDEEYTYTDIKTEQGSRIQDLRGRYCTYEWLWKDYRKTRAKFQLFEIKNGDTVYLHDEFKRTRTYPNGKINGSYTESGNTTNYNYVQMHETYEPLE